MLRPVPQCHGGGVKEWAHNLVHWGCLSDIHRLPPQRPKVQALVSLGNAGASLSRPDC